MTKPYNQALPFIVLGIVGIAMYGEAAFNVTINLKDYVPVLAAIGVGGAAKKAVERAAQFRAAIPDSMKKKIQDVLEDNVKKKT